MEILEGLLAGLRKACGEFPDPRRGQVQYSMTEIGISAFSLFFMQSESFLSFQRRLERGHNGSNCQTLFGIEQIPTDNHIRTLLDQVPPEALQPCFDQVIAQMQQGGGLQEFERLGDG